MRWSARRRAGTHRARAATSSAWVRNGACPACVDHDAARMRRQRRGGRASRADDQAVAASGQPQARHAQRRQRGAQVDAFPAAPGPRQRLRRRFAAREQACAAGCADLVLRVLRAHASSARKPSSVPRKSSRRPRAKSRKISADDAVRPVARRTTKRGDARQHHQRRARVPGWSQRRAQARTARPATSPATARAAPARRSASTQRIQRQRHGVSRGAWPWPGRSTRCRV